MSEKTDVHGGQLSYRVTLGTAHSRAKSQRWNNFAASAILVLGSPRSGTSWLAKIFDSHPAVLYRHEPDEVFRADQALDPTAQIAAWLRQRGLRVAAKRPHFPKVWRPAPVAGLRTALAAGVACAQRFSMIQPLAQRIPLPDMVSPGQDGAIRAAVKLVNWDGTPAVRAIPGVRCVFILRHPCGQVASVMAGRAASRFSGWLGGADTPSGLSAARERAARSGVNTVAFEALRDAAKLAWAWVAFNEPAVQGLSHAPNGRIVRYEDLCQEPERTARSLFSFADLSWHPQTARFVDESTRTDRGAGYFDVFRAGAAVADKWRDSLSPDDQNAVRSVVATSALARCWDDIG